MTTTEPQPAAPKPGRRFQYSLRAMFGLTTGTAAFFALGRMLGYADAIVILVGIVITVGVMEYPRRVYLPTGIMLMLVAGTLLWANLRTTGWQKALNVLPPEELDLVARSMFFRGWPISPFMTCQTHGMIFDPSEIGVHWILILDAAVFVVALGFVRIVGEFCLRKRDKPILEMPAHPQSAGSDLPPAGSTSGPPVE